MALIYSRGSGAGNRPEIAGAEGEAINIRWENQMREAAAELDRLLRIERPPEADASVN